jgi:hypothetical protein
MSRLTVNQQGSFGSFHALAHLFEAQVACPNSRLQICKVKALPIVPDSQGDGLILGEIQLHAVRGSPVGMLRDP